MKSGILPPRPDVHKNLWPIRCCRVCRGRIRLQKEKMMTIFTKDKAQHIAAMVPLFSLVAASAHWLGAFAAAAVAVTVAGLQVEIREGEAYSWYRLGDYSLALKRALRRSLGLQGTKESKDSLFDWLTPAVVAWLVYAVTLIVTV